MKKLILSFGAVLVAFAAHAANPTYIEEVKALGFVSGQGLACNASKYDTYEMLARAILVTKAKNDVMQEEGMRAYNDAKVDAFISKIRDGMSGCRGINDSFNEQKIFKAVLYGDGSIKMPDGKTISPRKPYDPTLVYKKDPAAREKMIKKYENMHSKILNDPNYKKALNERRARDGY